MARQFLEIQNWIATLVSYPLGAVGNDDGHVHKLTLPFRNGFVHATISQPSTVNLTPAMRRGNGGNRGVDVLTSGKVGAVIGGFSTAEKICQEKRLTAS